MILNVKKILLQDIFFDIYLIQKSENINLLILMYVNINFFKTEKDKI